MDDEAANDKAAQDEEEGVTPEEQARLAELAAKMGTSNRQPDVSLYLSQRNQTKLDKISKLYKLNLMAAAKCQAIEVSDERLEQNVRERLGLQRSYLVMMRNQKSLLTPVPLRNVTDGRRAQVVGTDPLQQSHHVYPMPKQERGHSPPDSAHAPLRNSYAVPGALFHDSASMSPTSPLSSLSPSRTPPTSTWLQKQIHHKHRPNIYKQAHLHHAAANQPQPNQDLLDHVIADGGPSPGASKKKGRRNEDVDRQRLGGRSGLTRPAGQSPNQQRPEAHTLVSPNQQVQDAADAAKQDADVELINQN